MAQLGSWKIDDYLTFCCNTHSASTGAATDADAVPSYRIYEDETGTPILTGSMAKLDDAGTTGFYSEQIQLTAANGLEKGKSYNVYISAAVGGVTGTMSHTFQMEAEVDANVISDKTGFSLAADQSGVTVGTVSTLTGHTAQTGDTYAALPTNFADLSITATTGRVDVAAIAGTSQTANDNGADINAILADTGTDGVVVAAGSKTGYSLAADQSAVTIGTVSTLTGHTAQTGDTYGALPTNFSDLSITVTTGRVDVASIEGADATDQINTAADTALTDYDPPTKAEMDTAHALLATPAQVNAQVLDVLNTDTFAEPGQGAPAATASIIAKIGYLYKFLRNKIETTSSLITIYNDDGTTAGQKSTISDDGTTTTRGEFTTGA